MTAVKFTFDTVFEGSAEIPSQAAQARKRRTLSEAEIESLRTEAHAQGRCSGEVQAQEQIAAGAREAVRTLREALAAMEAERKGLCAGAADAALAAARKLARAALARLPAEEVEQALREAMHQAIGEPRLVLRASPAVAEALAGRIAEIAHDEGFEGRVQIAPDNAFANSDCRIEWRGGGVERAEAAIDAALDDLFARLFSGAATIQYTEE
ncbi:MAG: hypothetical protein KGJ75_15840 [Alphaproteobacteria bacterium]|nr:hypothetical protein [Alphaproteobacteria bacterium]